MSGESGAVEKKLPDWRHRLGQRATALLLISALSSALGLLGTLHHLLELFSHFLAWQGMLSLLVLLLSLCARKRRLAMLAALVAGVQLWPVLSWYIPVTSRGETANCRVLIANVLTPNPDKGAFLKLVEEADPDIIFVQETDSAWIKALAPLESRYPLHTAVPRSDNFGIALYSRLPGTLDGVLFQREHSLPALAATIAIGSRAISVLNIHTLPPMTGPMAFRRDAQLDSARAWLQSQPGPALMAGDLNLTQYSPVYRRFMRGLDARNARAGHGPIGTWPAWLPFAKLPLDHCFVRGDIEVIGCTRGPDIGSDHLPLIVDLNVVEN